MWKWILIILVFLAVVVAGGGVLLTRGDNPPLANLVGEKHKKEEGKPVRLAEVHRGRLTRTVSAPGAIEPQTAVEISAQVSARIVALPFEEGDTVRKGDVVVRLDARDLEASLTAARAQRVSAEAQLDGAKADFLRSQADFSRIQELYDTKDVSKSELDVAEADFLQARSRQLQAEQAIEVAKAEIQRREKDLDNAIITSAIDGVIVSLNAEVGETVVVGTLNNPGSVIMEIADLTTMLLKAQVDESNIAPVREGQRARVYINAYSDTVYDGEVKRVGLKRQIGSDGVGFFIVEILVDTTDTDRQLLSGLSANTEIEVEDFFDVILAPSQAVVERRVDELDKEIVESSSHIDDRKTFARVVYVVGEDMKTEARPVSVGPSDLRDTVILGGLEDSERIVIGPYRELVNIRNDQKVRDMDAKDEDKDKVEGDEAVDETEIAADDEDTEEPDQDADTEDDDSDAA